jgi:phosphohistidine phosphatase SixA
MVRFALQTAFLALLTLVSASAPSAASEAAVWAALRQGGHVALIRHADAPGVPGDPPGFKLEDCATQRNLSEAGKLDAAKLGQRLRAAGVTIGRVVSSPWCRCTETAKLLHAGPVAAEPAFANAFSLADERQALRDGARRIIAAWQGPGTLVAVTHGANILAITGINPASAEMIVVRATPGGEIAIVGRLAASDP